MGYSKIQEKHMHDYGYTDIAGKSRKELTNVLARLRAMEVDVNKPENQWY